MHSLWLTYSGVSGGQYLTFKPTLLAALLASGFGSYLYLEQPGGGLQQDSEAGRIDRKSGFDAGFYAAAKAAEPRLQIKFAPNRTATDIDQAKLLRLAPADTGLEPAAFISAMKLDEQAQAGQRFRPQLGQTGSEPNQDADPGLQEPAKVDLAAIASAPPSSGSAAPGGLVTAPVPAQPELGREEQATERGFAMPSAGQSAQANPNASTAAAAAPAVLREGLAVETETGSALAKVSQTVEPGALEPAAFAISPAVPPPMLANVEAVAELGIGVAAPATAQPWAVSPPALATLVAEPVAPPHESDQARFVVAVAPAAREAPAAVVEPPANPVVLMDAHHNAGPAPLVLQPIKFKLDPKAKDASSSTGLAGAKRSERAGLVQPRANGSQSRKQSKLPDRVVGEFIFHQVAVRLNDSPAGNIDVRIGGDAILSVRVGSLLSVVEGRLDPDLFAALNASAGADAYVSFRELRAAGIDVRYDPAGDTIVLSAD